MLNKMGKGRNDVRKSTLEKFSFQARQSLSSCHDAYGRLGCGSVSGCICMMQTDDKEGFLEVYYDKKYGNET